MIYGLVGERGALASRPPFTREALSFFEDLSASILRNRKTLSADSVAFGLWCRPKKINGLRQKYFPLDNTSAFVRAPVGLSFHVAPANVDSVFAYTWALSVLAGNTTVVRLSSRAGIVSNELLEAIKASVRRTGVKPWWHFFSSSHDDELFRNLIGMADSLVLWGGDEAISEMLTNKVKPSVRLMTFPNRISSSVMRANELMTMSEDEISFLAERFWRDLTSFGQQACSSPLSLVWVGSKSECIEAQSKFWAKVGEKELDGLSQTEANTKRLELAVLALRGNRIHPDAFFSSDKVARTSQLLQDSDLSARDISQKAFGLISELYAEDLYSALRLLSGDMQTVSYEGFHRSEIMEIVSLLASSSPLRFTPVGTTLDFSEIWDGHSLITGMTKTIMVS